jgi:alkanesulfonate monooxygenase SsuD/methylene tetrahydromethanopterin reductase-like flavin-dependent oxidoreductase (luciferase family)
MRIGLIQRLNGRPDGEHPAPTWDAIRTAATTAEQIGFDTFVFEDALLYRGTDTTDGCWESVSIAAAVAAVTSRIEFGQSVVNSPYRSPALLAKIADTIDEISNGRYILGMGAGNTDDADYQAFGFPTDKRYSRFAEAIEIVHGLLKNGQIDFIGEYWSARDAELVLRGPRPKGPPIVIAAKGPKMLRLAARFGDGWNWWTGRPHEAVADLKSTVEELELACAEVGRDPDSMSRSIDVYTIDPLKLSSDSERVSNDSIFIGSNEEIAEMLLALRELDVDEVRCDLYQANTPKGMIERIEAMAEIIDLVHAG